MIQFERIGPKGERLTAYTHKSYLSKDYNNQICRLEKRNHTWINSAFYGTGIATYWALHRFQGFNNFVAKKLHWKGKFLIVSALVGLADSFLTSVVLTSSLRSTHDSLLKKQSFPAWFNKQRVVNPERVFFELDDNNNNEPSIYHSAISHSAIQRLAPDFIVGTPHKPHYPVAETHHH